MPASAQLLVILLALLGFWAIVMRPARNQQKRVQALQAGLEIGQEVVLSSGIFGTIRALEEGRVQLEVAPGTVLTVARQVVVRVVEDQESGDTSGHAPRELPADPPEDKPGDTPGDAPRDTPRSED